MSTEEAVLCSAVSIFSDEAGMGVRVTKRVLWVTVREWEKLHDELAAEVCKADVDGTDHLQVYVRGLKCQISQNEVLSRITRRYHRLDTRNSAKCSRIFSDRVQAGFS